MVKPSESQKSTNNQQLASEPGRGPGKAPHLQALRSMTGMAAGRGDAECGSSWTWDLRSVNGRGLDLRLRLPEGLAGLEAGLRSRLQARVARGSVTLGLRLTRAQAGAAVRLDPAALEAVLARLAQLAEAAARSGLRLADPDPVALIQMRELNGAEPAGADEGAEAALVARLLSDFDAQLDAFDAMRAAEGAALGRVIAGQIDRIAELCAEARAAAEARRPDVEAMLGAALDRLGAAATADPQRLAQELALIAVKSDVTEEVDRIDAHTAAARELLARGGNVGRRFDFLMQEFMREANTLCSKSANARLTAIGLDLKEVIDQMREQVQNLE